MIQIGDRLPAITVYEYNAIEGQCAIGPVPVDVAAASTGKTVALFALPGAFTPTCSQRHLPGYIEHCAALRAAGVDEIWCCSVNDPFVMGAWGKQHGATGKVRMMGDGDAAFTRAVGLTLDLSGRGFGLRSQRYSMLVRDGVVQRLNVENGDDFALNDAQTLVQQAQALQSAR